SATTRLRTSSGMSPSRVNRLSSALSRNPRGVVISVGLVVDGLRDLFRRLLRSLLHGGRRLLPGVDHGIQLLAGCALAARRLHHLGRAVPQCAGQSHRTGLREFLHLVDLLLHRVELPDLERLLLDLLIALSAGPSAEHVTDAEADHESYLAPHGVSSRSMSPVRFSRVVPYADFGIRLTNQSQSTARRTRPPSSRASGTTWARPLPASHAPTAPRPWTPEIA